MPYQTHQQEDPEIAVELGEAAVDLAVIIDRLDRLVWTIDGIDRAICEQELVSRVPRQR